MRCKSVCNIDVLAYLPLAHHRSQGEYADWDVIDKLHTVEVPALILNGRADYMQDFVNAPFFTHIPRVKWITFEKSSHMPFWEERERYMQVVQNFLDL